MKRSTLLLSAIIAGAALFGVQGAATASAAVPSNVSQESMEVMGCKPKKVEVRKTYKTETEIPMHYEYDRGGYSGTIDLFAVQNNPDGTYTAIYIGMVIC
ncbi:hypothetical protein [Paenibacillus ehimensis]|uniref:Uncharacterized protein n=1 Tax=Paenibacillus ehimensis TaxID=79264 RepID=A0ABT8VH61_9BACL|nr:hypothetical protein [Paenibacillus ehimensis]MDO3680328.1 hypothetical protein [Paenibacillus ehimensis]MEC0211391.1 hypothetical protein [Paenibacillus ehimensis]